jgi:hypothetical protein
MLLEVMFICSLTHAYPFYDCSEHWKIEVYDEPVSCFVGHEILAAGCTNFETKTIRIYDYALLVYGNDQYGFTVLEHELEHLKCMCDFHS